MKLNFLNRKAKQRHLRNKASFVQDDFPEVSFAFSLIAGRGTQ